MFTINFLLKLGGAEKGSNPSNKKSLFLELKNLISATKKTVLVP